TGRPAYVAEIAAGMRRDMTGSVLFTAAIIAGLFWCAHRRWTPMLWLLLLLGAILAGTLALGGLVFGTIDVVSLGFAGILLGLAVDYGVVHYQEALASPDAIIPEIRRAIGPSIFWAAATTVSAFLVLNLGGLPGLGQLGSLVALGVGLSALVMLFVFLPPLFGDRMPRRLRQMAAGAWPPGPAAVGVPSPAAEWPAGRVKLVGALSLLLPLIGGGVWYFGLPGLDHSAGVLRPRHSPAEVALGEIRSALAQGREPWWLVLSGRTEMEVADRLAAARHLLDRAVANGWIGSYALPAAFWPRPDYQATNRATARQLAAGRESLRAAALGAGFRPKALELTDRLLEVWQRAAAADRTFWPTNALSRWILDRFVARSASGWVVVGYVFAPAQSQGAQGQQMHWSEELARQGCLLSGWDLLGDAVLARVQSRFGWVMGSMAVLVLGSLGLAFRRAGEILLSLAVLGCSAVGLLVVMRLMGWSWNLLNLMALPLMLGTGVDYSIFMQLALRRHGGDLRAAHRSVGRALLLCGGTAVAGFGSLAGSNYGGMASLGEVCAVGVGGNMLLSVYVLPVWWHWLRGTRAGSSPAPATEHPAATRPSWFYRAEIWSLGLFVGRFLPVKLSVALGCWAAAGYCALQPRRREVVVRNLLPVLNGERQAAERATRQLFAEFARKVGDLWRYESGRAVERQPADWSGWEIFTAAQARGRGVLLVTPHLGNWEIGGLLLAQRGVNLLALTQAEPERRLTALRLNSRARWGVETLVVGEDAFAFVEIIKRLQAGATVALLVDRPAPPTAVTVELFGRPFLGSIAAAELARATGCAVVPVYVVRRPAGYSAHVLPEVPYDRAALGNRARRIRLTQEILRAFEPVIRQHATQWYHFVPIWPPAVPPAP
ncbi:MAG: MMPL family transporter, partial [Verrucomicrobia bacterium]|nr:MMPL family transporter [Verrucomicrobiota bacterium]